MTVGLLHTPPLVVPELVFNKQLFSVKLHLDDPLISSKDRRRLLSLCAIADASFERLLKSEQRNSINSCVDEELLEQLETACRDIAPSQPAQVLLQQLGLLDMFPYLSQGIYGENKSVESSQNPGEHLSLERIFTVNPLDGDGDADGLSGVLNTPSSSDKQQCLNMLQGETKPIRRLVEARFDEIKQITESKNPILDLELSDWLQEITWLCREEIKNCPSYIHGKLQPMIQILQSKDMLI